jgi:hypothetical protein
MKDPNSPEMISISFHGFPQIITHAKTQKPVFCLTVLALQMLWFRSVQV